MAFIKSRFFLIGILLLTVGSLFSQESDTTLSSRSKNIAAGDKWYESINLRGYTQVRYNGLFQTNPDLKCDQCDRSWGGTNGFFFRRIRIIFFGNLHERLYFYIQPDFASSPGDGRQQFAQIRDAYFDLALDRRKEFRFRIGQSKVPFGFENLQSSQNRLPLDRNDGLNSAFANERDIGIFFYWAPADIRKLFAELSRKGLKHSGDYGVFGLGLFNGQTANQFDRNRKFHYVARLSYPFKFGDNQVIEPGIMGYTGDVVVPVVSDGVLGDSNFEYIDQRAGATFVLYPQPFGIQAEYNYGRGPEYNTETNRIDIKPLHGGYSTLSYRLVVKNHVVFPFARYQYYEGGKKHERDATSHRVQELEIGAEWLPFRNFELVVMYTISRRTAENALLPSNTQEGRLLRLQFQLNF